MTPEMRLVAEIKLYCGEHNWLCFHCNVGSVKTDDGRMFNTGLPVGFPDLLIITDFGRVIFCETKIHPRKPTQQQINFINNLKSRGFLAFVAYTLDDFVKNINF